MGKEKEQRERRERELAELQQYEEEVRKKQLQWKQQIGAVNDKNKKENVFVRPPLRPSRGTSFFCLLIMKILSLFLNKTLNEGVKSTDTPEVTTSPFQRQKQEHFSSPFQNKRQEQRVLSISPPPKQQEQQFPPPLPPKQQEQQFPPPLPPKQQEQQFPPPLPPKQQEHQFPPPLPPKQITVPSFSNDDYFCVS
jgi:hypothetical protein